MQTKFIEVSGGINFNFGKFLLLRFDSEFSYRSHVLEAWSVRANLLPVCGWTSQHIWVLDLQTGEGAFFHPGGSARADLHKHKIWVCPMYEPFLEWLYKQDLTDLEKLPAMVEFTEPDQLRHCAIYGYRRGGQ